MAYFQHFTMLSTLKRILLTQYIGAIVTGFITAQGILGVVTAIILPLQWHLLMRGRRWPSSFGMGEAPRTFDWNEALVALVGAALNLLVAYLLVRWLYMEQKEQTKETEGASGDS